MKLYYMVQDGGDGTQSVSWFKHYSRAEYLHENSDDYRCSDDIWSITIPDGVDVSTLGLYIHEEEGEGDDDDDEEE